ncbi:Chloramphenicol phosphotransferase-like protein, partial [Streptomyces sp. SolWspMP-sol7th]
MSCVRARVPYSARVLPYDVLVLNGGSSSGTTSLARALQDLLFP